MPETKKRGRKPKQKYIADDMAPGGIPKLDQLAETYYDAMQERLPYTKAEAEAKDALLIGMREEKLVRYETSDGFEVILNESFGVKVKKKTDAGENGDGE
jgi:hypothetical protein